MESWYRDRLHQNELILLSDSGFTTDQLTFRFLQHFIEHTKAGPDEPPKLLLMDNHGSHITPEFVLLAQCSHLPCLSSASPWSRQGRASSQARQRKADHQILQARQGKARLIGRQGKARQSKAKEGKGRQRKAKLSHINKNILPT